MLPTNRTPAHPGEILQEDFLRPMDLTQTGLAKKIGKHPQVINEIVNGKRGITAETALLFAEAFDTSAEFWMNLQSQHDLGITRQQLKRRA